LVEGQAVICSIDLLVCPRAPETVKTGRLLAWRWRWNPSECWATDLDWPCGLAVSPDRDPAAVSWANSS